MDVTPITSLSGSSGLAPGATDPEVPGAGSGYRVEALERLMDEAVVGLEEIVGEPLGKMPPKLKVMLNIDKATNRVVAALIDPESGEVKQQLPPEALLRSAAQLHEMLDRLIDIEA
jgi:uncharacterized FlaG/YvyC family protein